MENSGDLRLLLLDDHVLFAEALVAKFQEHGIACDMATSEEACAELLERHTYDAWLCDVNLPHSNGLDFIAKHRPNDHLRVFLLSAYNEPYLIERARRIGAAGFLTKTTPFDFLMHAVQHRNEAFLVHPEVPAADAQAPTETAQASPLILTRQERRVIQLVVDGLSSKEIADRLFISKYTVDTHRRNILKKLDAKSVSAMIRIAHEKGLVD